MPIRFIGVDSNDPVLPAVVIDATNIVTDNGVTGDIADMYVLNVPARGVDIRDGSVASPITGIGPTLKVSRTEQLTRATVEAAPGSAGTDGADRVAAIMGVSNAVDGSETQPIGVVGCATNASDNDLGAGGTRTDACAIYGFGWVKGNNPCIGIGAFLYGRRENDVGGVVVTEMMCGNYGTLDTPYNPLGASDCMGLWINPAGNADSGAAIQVSNNFNRQFDVGIAFTGQVNGVGDVGGVKNSTFRDDGNAFRSLHIKGAHATAAIAVASGAGKVGVGTESPTARVQAHAQAEEVLLSLHVSASQTLSASSAFRVRNTADTANLIEITPFGHFRTATSGTDFPLISCVSDTNTGLAFTASDGVAMSTNAVVRQRWSNDGVQFGTTLALGGGTGVIGIANATTVPTTNPSGGGVQYVEGGALKYRGSAGTVTTLAPA